MPQKKKAVALKYNLEQDLAPVVIASGYGEVAEKIINIAEERGIPVYRDDSAASMLCMLEVGASIPEELYQVVATIYVQIMETANRIKEGTLGTSAATGGRVGSRSGGRIFTPMDAPYEAGLGQGVGEGPAPGAGYGGEDDESGFGAGFSEDGGMGGGEGDGFVESYPPRASRRPGLPGGEGEPLP